MKTDYDIIIAGAGVAGCTLAWKLSENSKLNIALVEKKERIGSKRSAGVFYKEFVDFLRRNEFENSIKASYEFLGLYAYEKNLVYDYGEEIGCCVDYERFCKDLIKRSECDIFTDKEIKNIEIYPEKVKAEDLDSKIIIDATGNQAISAEISKTALPSKYCLTYGAKFKKVKSHNKKEISLIFDNNFCKAGSAFYPLSKSKASYTIADFQTHRKTNYSNLSEKFNQCIKDYKPFSRFLQSSELENLEIGLIPLEPSRKLVHKRIVSLGDSAGQCLPLLAAGLQSTVESAVLLNEIINKSYTGKNFDLKKLTDYEKMWNNKNLINYIMQRISGDMAFSRNKREWMKFMKILEDTEKENVLEFIRYRNKKEIRKKFPKVEYLTFFRNLLRYGVDRKFDFLLNL